MKLDWFSVTVTLLFVAIIIGITISINNKVIEPFTELYFNDFKKLPKITNGDEITFSYTINNLEGQDFTYDVNLTAELFYNNRSSFIQLRDQDIIVRKDNNATLLEKISINDSFEKIKVKVRLDNKDQDIHFFSLYAKETFEHPVYGLVSLDCLPSPIKIYGNKLIIGLRADYGQGWPIVLVFMDGRQIANLSVDSKDKKDFEIGLNPDSGLHVIDILFDNDKYLRNATTQIVEYDRNVYVESVKIGNPLAGVIDKGSNFGAFDCQDYSEGKGLYQNGAYRLRFMS